MIKAIIIDDEINGAEALQILLYEYCKNIEVCALAHSAEEGISAIKEHTPQLVFLDIEMPTGSGFEVISQTSSNSYQVIFTTAYSQYALKALKAEAVDYVLKPIDADELKEAVSKALKRLELLNSKEDDLKVERLINVLRTQKKRKINVSTSEGIRIIDPEHIIRLEADSNYTHFFLSGNKKIMVSKSLKEYEDLMDSADFIRVHQSHLVNINYIETYVKGEGGILILKDGSNIPVSRAKKQELLIRLFGDNS